MFSVQKSRDAKVLICGCYAVSRVLWVVLECCYAVSRVFKEVPRVCLICGYYIVVGGC